MPKLKDHRETKEVELPTSGAKIQIAHSLLSWQIEELREFEDENEIPAPKMLKWLIKDWDFTVDDDEGGEKIAEITEENIKLAFAFEDIKTAMEESGVNDFLEEEADIDIGEVKETNTEEPKQSSA